MNTQTFVRLTRVEASAGEVFAWHERPGALERLTPPWIRVSVPERTDGIRDGARVTLLIRKGPFAIPWVVEHRDYQPGRQFKDVQLHGPFAQWEHTHNFDQDGAACYLQDRVEYRLPFGAAGRWLGEHYVRSELERLFVYRHRVVSNDIAVHRAYPRAPKPRRILLSGASGFIGTALRHFLTTGGYEVAALTRRANPAPGWISWDPARGQLDPAALEGFDAVIHLAGEPILSLRWTAAKKARILSSRAAGTRLLAETLSKLNRPPQSLLCASATGIYGERGGEILDESSAAGDGFLSRVCREWESATESAAAKGIRVVNLRFGLVLSPAGGALAAMLPAWNAGLGGPLGTGYQYGSWIALDDAIEAVYHAMLTPTLRGPLNIVAPTAAVNREFSRMLGGVIERPAVLRAPASLLNLALGEMARETLLASTRVEPRKLLDSGFVFHYPELETALRHVLGRT